MADLEWARARVAERRADLEKWGPEIRVNRSIAAAKLAEAEDWLRQMEAEPPIAALRALVSDLESAKENGKSSSSPSGGAVINVGAVSASVEARILEKIVSVCEPAASAGAAAEKAGAVGVGNDGKRRTAV